MTSFSHLGLAEPIVRALTEANHVTPTPIQAEAIPQILAGRDLIGIAQTGTGKTAAFALPILDRLVRHPHRPEPKSVRALVLSPTRELSGQIVENFEKFGRHARISVTLAIGGVPMGRQIRALSRGVDVLVATPGRLIDLVENNAVRLDQVEVLVLDEADQMLDMGFVHAIRAIVRRLPHKRHSLFFSATMPHAIAELAGSMLHNPARVAVTPVAKTADRVEQRVILVDKPNKGQLLAEVLSTEEIDRALVFARTKHGADKVVRVLAKAGIAAEAIHGNKSQNQRDRVLAAFREGTIRTLIATDIAARGIDVTGVSHVINFDLPNVPESYVHRIGRTARAGREGIAISFCDHEERAFLRSIEKLIKMQLPASDRRGAGTRFAVPQLEPIILEDRDETAERNDYIGRSGRQNFRGQRPRQGGERSEERSGEARSRPQRGGHGRLDEARPQAERPHQPRGEGRPAGGRPEGRAEHAANHGGGNGAGHRSGQPARPEARSPRPERGGQRPAGDIGGLGFMQAVPNRGQRPEARPGGAKRPVR
ncbi:DEAD/DEAH box helicase [Xanthobacter autotrophicus]|uniref:DEAD/DEAH box helicase n=1 Tax=Xanthobacter TaxID=279 RepID=UPI0024AAE4C1|nr:DEAD/DEAH box helicase [Xanthobacter autotrophicus]MDI4663769.1 DEAD/DEAH box helicase [Xanthobacter autotrophicus]